VNSNNPLPPVSSATQGRQLFRPESLAALQPRLQGQVILTPSLATWIWCALAVVVLAAIAWFVTQASYTRRSTVAGQLVPVAGMIRVQTPQQGVILERRVAEGQAVRKGDVLYVINTDRASTTSRDIQLDISREIESRKRSMEDEIARNLKGQSDELSQLRRRMDTLKNETLNNQRQLEQQRRRVAVAEDLKKRYQGLSDQDYIAKEQLIQKEVELSEQQLRLQVLERDAIVIQREQASTAREIDSTTSRYASQNAGLQRAMSSAQQELTEAQARRSVVITAPEDGRATLVTGEVGQVADTARPLLNIVPAQSQLQVKLFAPSYTIGFIRPDDKVLVRYQAFPYQKFGLHDGKVVAVSTAAVPSTELAGFTLPEMAATEPVYAITVNLASQTVMAYGQPQTLQAGQRLEADILQETRKLYEWMLEPLYSITGKMAR
jgi:membrane fusion protein